MSDSVMPSPRFAPRPAARLRPGLAPAVTLMLLGAALEVAGAVLAIATQGSLAPWFAASQSRASASQIHALVVAQVETQLAFFLPAAACWLVMAYANSHAKGNAPRIISTLCFVMGLSILLDSGAPRSTAVVVISAVVCLVGAATVVLLFSDIFPRRRPKGAGTAEAADPLPTQRTNRLAIAALVCGFLSLILFPAGIAAIIMAPRAQRQIGRSGENGHDLAALARGLGYAGLTVAVVGLLVPLVMLLLFTMSAAPSLGPGLPAG